MRKRIKHIIIAAILTIISAAIGTLLFFGIRTCVWMQDIRYQEPEVELHDIPAKQVNITRPKLTKRSGVYMAQDSLDIKHPDVKTSMRETWYGPTPSPHYMTSQFTIDENGFYRYMDQGVNCYVVAIKGIKHGTHVLISDGDCEAIVLDTPKNYGVVDVYVSW